MKNINISRLLIILTCSLLLFTGCTKPERAVILFSPETITNVNDIRIENQMPLFKAGQRINYLLYMPEPLKNNIIKIQVIKMNPKASQYGMTITQAREVQIDISQNYMIDYFFIHLEGDYMLRIFSLTDMIKPMAEARFRIE